MQNRIQAQWVCSRERRIALYKWSSIINQSNTIPLHTHLSQSRNLPQQELDAESLGDDAESEIPTYVSQSCNLSQQEFDTDSLGDDVESEIPTYVSQSCNLSQQELDADSLGDNVESEIPTYVSQSCNLSQQELYDDSLGEDVESEFLVLLLLLGAQRLQRLQFDEGLGARPKCTVSTRCQRCRTKWNKLTLRCSTTNCQNAQS